MLSTDHTILRPGSPAELRMRSYGTLFDSLTVIVSGNGAEKRIQLSNTVTVIYPGGTSKVHNFIRMLYATRLIPADVVSAQDPLWTGLLALWSNKQRVQVQVHTDAFGYLKPLARYVLRRATCVRVVSERVKGIVSKWTRAPISVLPIYIDAQVFQTRRPKPDEFGDHPRVLVVSRLAPEKRVHLAVASMPHVPNAHLYLVGEGRLKRRLVALAKRLGVHDRVHFVGWKNDVVAYYQHADCVLVTSSHEGYGLVLAEAALAGCPIVSTRVGIAEELPKNLVTISNPDEYQLARAVNESLTEEKKRAAHEAGKEFSTWFKTHSAYLEAYRRLISECGS